MFRTAANKGWTMTFANGWTISVQFGSANYCDRRTFDRDAHSLDVDAHSPNAECAVWDENGDWLDLSGDQVIGWQTADDVAALISRVSAFPKESSKNGQKV